jgi:Glycosyl hydrolases family 43
MNKFSLKCLMPVVAIAASLLCLCGCKSSNVSLEKSGELSLQTIRPGAFWPDDRGQHLQAHGAGILKLGDTYYLFGEDRTRTNDPEKRYLACYSSPDLSHWHFCRQVVQLADPEHIGTGWVLERPKVFYHASTKKFVMYAHLDDSIYSLARVAVFECDQVDGDYHYLKSFRPLGHESRDLGQFIDDDGTAYLLSEDRPNGFRIYQLSDDDLSIAKEVCLIPEHLEGLALAHYGGLYYVVGSHLTGWDTNPNVYATASSLAGPWSAFADIAPQETKTYGSQSAFLLKVCGTEATNVIFIADIWKPDAQWDSRYLWSPLQIGDGKLWLPKPGDWTINIHTGVTTALNTAGDVPETGQK